MNIYNIIVNQIINVYFLFVDVPLNSHPFLYSLFLFDYSLTVSHNFRYSCTGIFLKAQNFTDL